MRVQPGGLIILDRETSSLDPPYIYGRDEILISAWDSYADTVLAGVSGWPSFFSAMFISQLFTFFPNEQTSHSFISFSYGRPIIEYA